MKKMKALSFIAALSMLACSVGCSSNNTDSNSEKATEAKTEAPTEAVDVPEIDGYNLLWNDEFSGSSLDETKWNYEPHEPGC